MRRLRALLLRLRGMRGGEQAVREMREEVALHVDLQAEANVRAGMSPEEARRQSLLKLGGSDQTLQAMRDRRGLPPLESLLQDTRFALRQLRTHPVFTVTAIGMLAIGIGASVAMFAFVDAALIRPLPYRDPSRLVWVTEEVEKMGPANLSYQDYLDWRRSDTTLQSLAVWAAGGTLLQTSSGLQQMRTMRVSANFFRTLDVAPVSGRDFREGEDLAGASRVVMLSYAAWQQYFNGRQDIVGTVAQFSGDAYTIVGVMPRDFKFAPRGRAAVFMAMHPNGECELRRSCHNLVGVGRLKDGVPLANADASFKNIARALQTQYPESNRGQDGIVLPLSEEVIGGVRPILLTLLTGAGLLLLIACINVANLLLARSEGRRREFALRGALGATAGRLLRQFATEGLLLVLAGAAIGLPCAAATLRLPLLFIAKPRLDGMPYLQTVGIRGPELLFTTAIVLAAALLFTLIPALRVSFRRLRAGMAESGSGSGSLTWRRLGANLVVLELATAMVLLVGAGLLTRSLYRLLHVDLGIDPTHLALMEVEMPEAQFTTDAARVAMQHRILERVAVLPGVESAAAGALLPLTYNGNTDWVRFVGRPYDGKHIEINGRSGTPDYFRTLHATLLHGRTFTEQDTLGKPLVAVVNRRFAEMYFPGEDPLGKQFGNTDLKPDSIKTIVGVIDDMHEGALDDAVWPAAYYPSYQTGDGYMTVAVRTRGSDAALLPTLHTAVRGLDARLGTGEESTMEQQIHDSMSSLLHRGAAWLVGAFAVVALLLSAVGLYGVIAYSVSQRTREIGMRMALGAQKSTVYSLILREAAWLSAAGIALGVALAVGAGQFLHSLLFGVKSWDVTTLAGVAMLLSVCALVASYVPAHRAASVDPVEALRGE